MALKWQAPVKSPKLWQSLMPMTFNQYWFVTGYLILILLVPFINQSVQNLTKRQFIYLLIIVTIICGIFPLVNNDIATQSVGLGVLLAVYLFGVFVAKFIHRSSWNYVIGLLLFTVNTLVIYIIMYFEIILTKDRFTNIYTGVFAMLAALGLFLIFTNFKPVFHVIFNQVARHIFAVYLITQNVLVLKPLWKNFQFKSMHDLVNVNLSGFVAVLEIMVVCYLIDIIRLAIFRIIIRVSRRR
nr:acyltransferase family protein [Companilactobacillus keshanensis]